MQTGKGKRRISHKERVMPKGKGGKQPGILPEGGKGKGAKRHCLATDLNYFKFQVLNPAATGLLHPYILKCIMYIYVTIDQNAYMLYILIVLPYPICEFHASY